METPPRTKREHLRQLTVERERWDTTPVEAKAKGFRGWHERGYLPHCDQPGLIQFITFRLWNSMPASRRGEWEHLLAIRARSNAPRSESSRERRQNMEEYLDRGLGDCVLREPRIATLVETVLLHHHNIRFRILAWVVMPNHIHALVEIGEVPLSSIIQNWKSIVATRANPILGRTGRFWQPDYWDHFMRDEEQARKAIRYIEDNPVKARLCRTAEEWPFSSARFREPETGQLKLERGASLREQHK